MKYRKRPVTVDAIQWDCTERTLKRIKKWDTEWCSVDRYRVASLGVDIAAELDAWRSAILVKTIEGDMRCNMGDWIVRGVEGELYPVRDDIFRKTYRKVRK